MKLLFTSDPHAAAPADLRLATRAQARGCALLAIAGDLLDLFAQEDASTQAHAAAAWLGALAARVPHLAVCSGNHDPDGPDGANWLARAAAGVKTGHLLADGASAVLWGEEGDLGLIVSCCPYWNIQERSAAHHVWLRDQAEGVWAEGRRLADQHAGLPWVVLHHEPPEGTRVAVGAWTTGADFGGGGFWAAEWCRQYRPDYLLSGHIHQAPFVEGGSWADRVEDSPTWAFNPGRDETDCRTIEIDLAARTARWFSSWDGELEDARALDGADPNDGNPAVHGPARAAEADSDPDDLHSVEWEIWRERHRHRPSAPPG